LRERKTRSHAARKAKNALEQVHVKIVGIVLNGARVRSRAYYGYGYGYIDYGHVIRPGNEYQDGDEADLRRKGSTRAAQRTKSGDRLSSDAEPPGSKAPPNPLIRRTAYRRSSG
jgi:Mrp family chromosome partitioning ATPase